MKRELLISVAISCLLCACATNETDDIAYNRPNESVWVRIQMDWSEISDGIKTSTVAFFPQDGGAPIYKVLNEIRDSIRLQAGRYSVIAFNGTLNSHDFSFEDTEDYDSFKAVVMPMENVKGYYVAQDDMASAHQPDELYVKTIDIFDISAQMVKYDVRKTLCIKPEREYSLVSLSVNIKGIDRLMVKGNVAAISGLPEGVYMGSGSAVESTVKCYANMENLSLKDGSNEGTMTFNYYVLGKSSESLAGTLNATLYLMSILGTKLDPIEVNLGMLSRVSSRSLNISVDLSDK